MMLIFFIYLDAKTCLEGLRPKHTIFDDRRDGAKKPSFQNENVDISKLHPLTMPPQRNSFMNKPSMENRCTFKWPIIVTIETQKRL